MDKHPRIEISTPADFALNEDAIDICSVNAIYSDWTMWKAWCKLASDLNTDVGTLWALFQAQILQEAGYWDPAKAKDVPAKVKVTLRDLQDSDLALRMGPNPFFQDNISVLPPRASDAQEDVED